MGRLAGFRYRDIVRRLKAFGFHLDRQPSGSHEIWLNPATGRRASLPRHSRDLAEGTLRSILRQAGIEEDDFLA